MRKPVRSYRFKFVPRDAEAQVGGWYRVDTYVRGCDLSNPGVQVFLVHQTPGGRETPIYIIRAAVGSLPTWIDLDAFRKLDTTRIPLGCVQHYIDFADRFIAGVGPRLEADVKAHGRKRVWGLKVDPRS